MRGALLLFLATTSLLRADADVTLFSAANVSQPWLAVSVDPRSAALGDAMVASSNDLHALRINPAGLSYIQDPEISFSHNEWDSALGLRQEYLSYGRQLGDGGLTLGFNYFSFGSFDNRDSSGALLDSTTDAAYALALGYGSTVFSGSLRWGIGLSGSQQSLGSYISTLYTGSLGLQYELLRHFWLGAAANNIQISSNSDGQAPGALQGGIAWAPFDSALVLGAEADKPNQGPSSWHLGAEWNFLDTYSLRAGYRINNGDASEVDSGFSAGAGIKLGPLQLDYAYVPYGDFSRTQRIGLTLNLSEGLFGNNIVIESAGVTQNAQAEYMDGVAAYKARDWYTAKVSLNLAMKIYPSFDKAGEVKVMLEDIDKKIASDKARGMTPEQKAKIAARLAQAKKMLEDGEPVKARKEVEAVLEFDGDLKAAVSLLNSINSRLANRLGGLKQEAFVALSQGDLRTAVLRYRKILEIDDSDAEANARLRKLSPRIRDEAKKMHREGIDLYVSGDVQKAVATWEQALEIDPSDQENIKRDLFKARKLLELRNEAK